LDGGRVVEDGPAAVVLSRPRSAFAATFAGLNLVSGTATSGGLRREDGTLLLGAVAGPAPAEGEPVVAVFRPAAVAVHREAPGGSPRNVLRTRVTSLEPLGGTIRVRAGDLAADVTVDAVADLGL